MKKISLAIIIVVLLVGLGIFMLKQIPNSVTGNPVSKDSQKITLGMKNYNYYPNTIKVKEGKEVEITLDKSVGGCYRNFNIPQFGVSERSSNPAQTIKFTPTQKGTFSFRCGMGMGTGVLIVE